MTFERRAGELPQEVVTVLRCPTCRQPFEETSPPRCRSGHSLEYQEGVVLAGVDGLSDAERQTVQGFGYEWNAFPEILPEDEPFWFRYSKDLDLDRFEGALAIDMGCGKGRFSWFLAPSVRHLVAVDASDSVFVAARNLHDRDNTTVIRADLFDAPLADQSFDLVCCIGVLHYVADPAKGFKELVRLLGPGGTLLLSVYSRPESEGVRKWGLDAAAAVRRITPRVPKRVLKALSLPLGVLLYASIVLPGRLGRVAGLRWLEALPLQTYRGRPVRSLWLDTFNRLHAPFEHRFVRSDIEAWLTDAGLVAEHIREDAGWMVVAGSPSQTPSSP